MALLVFVLDTDKPPGERLAPELREELAIIAPSTLSDGGVTTPKIKDRAVTAMKLALGAVLSANIGNGEVKAVNIDVGAVTAAALAAGSVTDAAAGPGVVTAHDSDGVAMTLDVVVISEEDYGLLDPPDPTTLYVVI